MKISFKDFDKVGRQRITQLINKSNQFNLTTKRYSENNIEKLEKNKTFFTRQIRLNVDCLKKIILQKSLMKI